MRFGRRQRQLHDQPSGLGNSGGALGAGARQMLFEFRALFSLQHAEGVLFVEGSEMFASHHELASPRDSRSRSSPPRIQLFTVPSASPMAEAISLCDIPSKNASSI